MVRSRADEFKIVPAMMPPLVTGPSVEVDETNMATGPLMVPLFSMALTVPLVMEMPTCGLVICPLLLMVPMVPWL